jgi:hypothetical protein
MIPIARINLHNILLAIPHPQQPTASNGYKPDHGYHLPLAQQPQLRNLVIIEQQLRQTRHVQDGDCRGDAVVAQVQDLQPVHLGGVLG